MDIAGADQRRVGLAVLPRRVRLVGQHDDVAAGLDYSLEVDLEVAPAVGLGRGLGEIGIVHRLGHLRKCHQAFGVGIGRIVGLRRPSRTPFRVRAILSCWR